MNEPAFPGLHPSKECHYSDAGMSLRDYFAAKAMQGTIANLTEGDDFNRRGAEWCYNVADMMLSARSKP